MSIRRRTSTINTSPADIWITNNSHDENITGSLRWAIKQASETEHTLIKVAHDFIDLAGVGRNMYVGGWVSNAKGVPKDITIDFSNTNVIFANGGFFQGPNSISEPTFKMQNMVVENQNFGTPTNPLFANMIDFTNCRFENLVSKYNYFQYTTTSTTTNCIFRNVVNNISTNMVFNCVNGTHRFNDCIFDNTVGVYGGSSIVDFSKCYINVSGNLVRYDGTPTINFSQCYIRNSGTNVDVALMTRNYGALTNCTLVNMRISAFTGSGEKPSNIRNCTQIYTLPIVNTTILNTISASLAHTIQNNIFISPNSTSIFPTNLTSLTESNNLYLCANANAKFPKSTHYGKTTPLTTLINTNEQGVGDTFKRYYLPTITNNAPRIIGVLQNQIEQTRTNPTNIGAI